MPYADQEAGKKKRSARHKARTETDVEYRARVNANARKYREQNREKCRESNRRHMAKKRASDPGFGKVLSIRAAERKLLKDFGLTLAAKQAWMERVVGCEICTRPFRSLSHAHVDHCHKTGKVRGLLCAQCNTALGLLKDSPDRITAALGYLERNNGTERNGN